MLGLGLLLVALAAAPVPRVLWSSSISKPNQTLLLTGAFPSGGPCTLDCEGVGWGATPGAGGLSLAAVEASATSAAFVWPPDAPVAAADQCTVACGGAASPTFRLNLPDVFWLHGSGGSGAYNQSTGRPAAGSRGAEIVPPGGTIRLFGRNLGGATALLVPSTGAANVTLTPLRALSSDNSAAFAVPSSLQTSPTAAWSVAVRNNLSGCPFVTAPDPLTIGADPSFDESKVFAVAVSLSPIARARHTGCTCAQVVSLRPPGARP